MAIGSNPLSSTRKSAPTGMIFLRHTRLAAAQAALGRKAASTFKSPGSTQRFLSTHAAVYNTFNVQRHLTSAQTHRTLRAAAIARKLGASDYLDSAAQDPAKALAAMGRAKAILATVTDGKAMHAIAGGLGANGVMMVIGAVGPLTLDSSDLLGKRASVKGRDSGIARDSEDTLNFSQRNNVASMNEIYPLEKAQEAFERMLSGKVRFRVVLKMDG
jgi:D-arabinose 1-dehydrogenase-like Zn-dependent alcohol dehydrogenase